MTKLRCLNIPSLTAEILKVLEKDKIKTVETLLFAKFHCSLDPQVLARIIKDVQSYFVAYSMNFNELLEITSNQSFSISTPSKSLNSLFGGNICSGQVVEICGSSACGKTQFCEYLSMIAAQNSGVYYIDTNLSFSSARIRQMFQNYSSTFGSETSEVEMLDKIRCFEIFDAFVLLNLLEQINAMLECKESYFGKNLRVLVIDSITSLIAPIIGGIKKPNNTKYPQRQGHALMIEISRMMKEIAVNHDVIVLATNSLTGEDGGEKKPALGAIWISVPSIRVILTKEKYVNNNQIYCASVESSNVGVSQEKFYFQLKASGIVEYQES